MTDFVKKMFFIASPSFFSSITLLFIFIITKPAEMDEPQESPAANPVQAAPAAVQPRQSTAQAQPSADIDPNLIGSLWSEVTDPNSGKNYYYNKKTKKTAWKRPECMDQPDPTGPAAASPTPVAVIEPVRQPEPIKEQPKVETPAPTQLAGSEWSEAKDPKSGRTYWYNRITKQTTWKNPHEDAAAVAAVAPVAQPQPQPQPQPVAQPQPQAQPKEEDVKKAKLASALAESSEDEAAANVEEHPEDEDGNKLLILSRDSDSDGEENADFHFAKHRKGIFNRILRTKSSIMDNDKILTWKRTCIKKALLKQNRQLDKEAIQAFRNVMSYMGDRSSSKPPIDHAKKMIRNLMISPSGLRDEVYMQIAKQTNKNPKTDNAIKGWELMAFCLATFPPSRPVKTFLVEYINRTIGESGTDSRVITIAKYALIQLEKIQALGQRKQIPSVRELDALRETRKVSIDVPLLNGDVKVLEVDSYTTVEQVEQLITQRMHLVFTEPFGLYEVGEANIERLLSPKERILDVIASWENEPLDSEDNRTGSKNAPIYKSIYTQLLYKAKLVLKMNVPEIQTDVEAINLLYIQAVHDIVTDRYPVKEKDVVVLAALQLQAQHGDYKPNVHTQGWLSKPETITQYIPQALILADRDAKQPKPDLRLCQEWEDKIMSKYKKFNGFTALESKTNYLQLVQEWTFYGATFFQVEQRQFKDYPAILLLGITCESILLMHPTKRTVLENYPFPDIVTWGHSSEKFILVVGNIVQQRKLIFKSDDGHVLNLLVHEYVRFKVKAKAASNSELLGQ